MLSGTTSCQQRFYQRFASWLFIVPLLSITTCLSADTFDHPHKGALQIFVDPNTGEFLPADQKDRADPEASSQVTARSKKSESDDSLRKVPPSDEITEDKITHLPGGGRMIDISGQFRAHYRIERTEPNGKLKGQCHTESGLHRHAR